MGKPRLFHPMPGYAVLAPIKDEESRIVLPATVGEDGVPSTSMRLYIVELGSLRVPSHAGFIEVPLKPGMEVTLGANVTAAKPDSTVERYLVRIYDIIGYRQSNEYEENRPH